MPYLRRNKKISPTVDDLKKVLPDDSRADRVFDRFLPPQYQEVSARHWSSAGIARRVAQWLEKGHPGKKIIDIGSGVGKFCVLLGLQSRLQIFGIEQRKMLHDVSLRLKETAALDQVTFLHGNMLDISWQTYDIYYFYNPFQEHIVNNGWSRIDHDLPFSSGLYGKYIDEIFRQLVWAEKGKVLITYHGYGGVVPSTWNIVHRAPVKNGELCMWEKMA